ncbi:COX aromatic rich motif-containing protein [Bacillus sp. HC-Mk]
MAAFEKLAAPSEYNQVEYFSNVKRFLLLLVSFG